MASVLIDLGDVRIDNGRRIGLDVVDDLRTDLASFVALEHPRTRDEAQEMPGAERGA